MISFVYHGQESAVVADHIIVIQSLQDLQTFGSLVALKAYNSAKESYLCILETKEHVI